MSIENPNNDFRSIVPAKFQERAIDWLFERLNQDIEEGKEISANNPDCDVASIIDAGAKRRAEIVRHMLSALFAPIDRNISIHNITFSSMSAEEFAKSLR